MAQTIVNLLSNIADAVQHSPQDQRRAVAHLLQALGDVALFTTVGIVGAICTFVFDNEPSPIGYFRNEVGVELVGRGRQRVKPCSAIDVPDPAMNCRVIVDLHRRHPFLAAVFRIAHL